MAHLFSLGDHDGAHEAAGLTLASVLVSPPSPQQPRWADWLVAMLCAVVFAAELGAAFGVVKVSAPLPLSRSPGVETALLIPLETGVKTEDPVPADLAPAAEVPPVQLEEQPLIAALAETSVPLVPLTADRANSKYDEGSKIAESRRHRTTSRPKQTKNGGDRQASTRRNQEVLAEEIYQPGRRAPGW
jgi:hypothetical protein